MKLNLPCVSRVYRDREPPWHTWSYSLQGPAWKADSGVPSVLHSHPVPSGAQLEVSSFAVFLRVKIASLLLLCKTGISLCFRFIPGQTFWGWSEVVLLSSVSLVSMVLTWPTTKSLGCLVIFCGGGGSGEVRRVWSVATVPKAWRTFQW